MLRKIIELAMSKLLLLYILVQVLEQPKWQAQAVCHNLTNYCVNCLTGTWC